MKQICLFLVGNFALISCGCAQHYRGSVLDASGQPVTNARVEGRGMHGGMITGEGPFVRSTVTDSVGHFDLVSGDWPNEIIAISPDSKHSGRISVGSSHPPYLIVVR